MTINPSLMRKAMEAANQRGCSRIIVQAPGKRGLLIGLLNQRRWWTVTRARLCAQHIIREQLTRLRSPGARMSSAAISVFSRSAFGPISTIFLILASACPSSCSFAAFCSAPSICCANRSIISLTPPKTSTAALRSTIENDLRQTGEVKGFNKRTFEFVVRQGQWRNFNGTLLTKTPDLFFKLRDDDQPTRLRALRVRRPLYRG